MDEQWHFARAGKKFGPVSTTKLRQLVSSGRLGRLDLVWKEGMSDWTPAEKIKGLFAATASALPPLSPQVPSQFADQTKPARRQGRAKTSYWTYLILGGAGLFFVAFVTPWWSYKEYSREAFESSTLNSLKKTATKAEGDAAFRAIEKAHKFRQENARKNLQWYLANFGGLELVGDELSLWGWDTVPGWLGFVFCLIIPCLTIPPLFVPILRRWGWIGTFGSALFGFIVLLLSMIWFLRAPGANMSGVLSQGVLIGTYLAMIGGLLTIISGILAGISGLKEFMRRV